MSLKTAIMTIDTESHIGHDPVERLILGKLDNGTFFGIDKIMDICDQHHIKGLFFVDIAEAWDYGKEAIADVLVKIKKRGHDVGVHIHPDHMADKNRLFLWEYTYEEQFDIIKKCTDFYYNILGEKPKAFRAGKYGANAETLDIIGKLGYLADFSEFYGQKWCRIEPPPTKICPVRLENGVMEFPVISYESFSLGKYSRFDKIDLEIPYREHKKIMKQIKQADMDIVISLFAHSFSLLNWRLRPNKPKANLHNCRKLSKMIYYTRENVCDIVSLDTLLGMDFIENNTEPELKLSRFDSLCFFVVRAMKVIKMRLEIKIEPYFNKLLIRR